MLVEDDDVVRQVVSESLSEVGENVAAFAHAEAAMGVLGLLGENALVITDINLGDGKNGIRFASLALAQCPWLGIIYITGRFCQLSNHRLGAREKALQKPFRFAELLAVIASLRNAK
jgi:CheY-like chemotaxis protein